MTAPLTRLLLASALAAVALTAAAGPASATSIAGANGKIVFASGRPSSGIPVPDAGDADARIWVADYPGGTPEQVTTLPPGTQHRHPNWSPDHTKIVYAAGTAFTGPFAIWIADLRTGTQSELVPAAAGQDRPTWSPDGTRIAYGSGGDLWVKDVAPGSTAVQITDNAAAEERPVWSPDGNTIYYNRGPRGDRDLYRKSPVTLAGAETAVIAVAGPTSDDWQPSVSPDGRRLCFLRGGQDSTADLWTVSVDGTGATPFSTTAGVGDLNCVWSPDGTRILYTLGAFTAGELATRNINGGDFQSLTSMNVASHFDGNADWATNLSPICDAKAASVAFNGFTTIALSCSDPDRSLGAAPPVSTPVDPDALEIATPPSHGSIGGLSNGRVVYTPNKDFSGTDSFTYTGSDDVTTGTPATVTIAVARRATGGGGGGGGAGGGTAKDVTPPRIARLAVSPSRWRLGSALPGIARTAVGTTISFRLDEAAQVTLGFQRAGNGRRVGRACAKPTRANRTHARCTRFARAQSIAPLAARSGEVRVRFQGRLSRSRQLAPGTYRVVMTAQDAAGNRSKPQIGPTFTIVAKGSR